MTSKDFGLDLTDFSKEKQGQLEKSLSALVQAARESIQESKKGGLNLAPLFLFRKYL